MNQNTNAGKSVAWHEEEDDDAKQQQHNKASTPKLPAARP
jgi:hypothetical protein